jgi:hypothetical protein
MTASVQPAEYSEETRYNEVVFRRVSEALIMLMMTCVALTISALIRHVFPDWNSPLVGALTLFIAFECVLTSPRYRKLTPLTMEWAGNLAAQWIAMLVIVRVAVGLSHGLGAFGEELRLLTADPTAYLLAPEFLLTMIICIVIWFLTGYFMELLDEMGLKQTLIALEVSSMETRYVPPRARLMSLVFTVGTILIFLTGLVRLDVRELFLNAAGWENLQLSALSGGGLSTVLYFMFGLALLSQTQFIALHTSWRMQGIRVNRSLVRNWGPYSLLFLAILVAIVSVLPTHYGLGMLAWLGYLIDVLVRVLFFIAQLILSLALFLITLPFMLFRGKDPQTELPPPLVLPEPPAEEAITGGYPWWALVRTILSWMLLLAIIGFSIKHLLRQHGEFADAVRRLPGGTWLVRIWLRLRALFGIARRQVADAARASMARLRAWRTRGGVTTPGGFLSLRRLDPRQRIYYFYLALVRRGAEQGLTRAASQTPYEYASTLEKALPDIDADIESLTGSFVEARYSRREVPPEKANLVKATWARIRQALRGLKKA